LRASKLPPHQRIGLKADYGASGEPIVQAAVSHLANLNKIVKAAQIMGWTGFGMKEAHDLYKMVSGDKK